MEFKSDIYVNNKIKLGNHPGFECSLYIGKIKNRSVAQKGKDAISTYNAFNRGPVPMIESDSLSMSGVTSMMGEYSAPSSSSTFNTMATQNSEYYVQNFLQYIRSSRSYFDWRS